LLNTILKVLRGVTSIPIWIIVALAIVAAIVGGGVAVIIWAFIAVYAVCWYLTFVIPIIMSALALELGKQQNEFNKASEDVLKECPERCRGDVSIPECRVD